MTVTTEKEILRREVERLSAQGYDVFVAPPASLAPPFLKGHLPDAVALGKDKKIAIEVKRSTWRGRTELAELAELFKGHDDWEFRLIWVDPASEVPPVPTQSLKEIRTTISEIERLQREGLLRPAFLLAWATLEAASRVLNESEFARPQAPGRLVQIMSREGYLTPTQADRMRNLANIRNHLAHGALDAEVTAGDLDGLLTPLRSVADQIAAG